MKESKIAAIADRVACNLVAERMAAAVSVTKGDIVIPSGNPSGAPVKGKKVRVVKVDKDSEGPRIWARAPGINPFFMREGEFETMRTAKQGLQLRRKDRDTMSDTGGLSKGPGREPEQRPRRDDVRKPFRTKNKPSDQHDPDTDSDPDKKVD